LIYLLAIISLFIFMTGLYLKADIGFSPIFGLMFGFLYSYTDYDDGREHTLQVCFFVLSMTVIWNDPPNGLT
tara:strand:- start:192 stop:407 length:216 start_codon:yes stop_codon:yes gene_type:complete